MAQLQLQSTTNAVYTKSSDTPYPSEWIYPNDSYGTYFTGAQVQIYVGDLFVDEVDSLQLIYYANSVPYYGYASTKADGFGRGRDIVQGQFAINFVSQGYMYTVLKEWAGGFSTTNVDSKVQDVVNLYTQLAKAMKTNQSGSNNPGITNQVQQLRSQIAKASQGLSPSQMSQVGQLTTQSINQVTDEKFLMTNLNAIEVKVPFNIQISYVAGGREAKRHIKDCILISNEQRIDQSGQVILDCYGFIARSFN